MILADLFTQRDRYNFIFHFSAVAFVGAPQNFTIQPIGPEMLKFSWGLPPGIDVIEQIDFFVIDCEPTFLDDIQVDVQMLEITLTEFLPGTTYTCTVRAKRDELGSPAVQTATTPEGRSIFTLQ